LLGKSFKLFLFFFLFLNLSYAKLPFKIVGEIPKNILNQIEKTYTNETPLEISKIISNIPTFKAVYIKNKNTIYVLRDYYIQDIKIKKCPSNFDKNLLYSLLILQKYTEYNNQKKQFLKIYIKEIFKVFGYKVKKIDIEEKYEGKAVKLYLYIDADKFKSISSKKISVKEKIKNFLNFIKNIVKEKPKLKNKKICKDKNRKVGIIVFYGLDRSNIDAFENAILLKPGEKFSQEKLSKTINLLYSSGYFFSIKVKKVYTNNKIHLIFDVRDAPKYKIKSYIGYNFLYGLAFDLNLIGISPFKKGIIYSLGIKYQKNRLFDITLKGEKNFMSLSTEFKKEKLSDLSTRSISLYAQKKFFFLYGKVVPEIGLTYKDIKEEKFSRVLMYLKLYAERKNLDSLIFPTKGYLISLDTKYMFSFNLYYNIIKLNPKLLLFLPVKEEILTYKFLINAGYLKNLKENKDASEYFYLGGFNNLRGFDYKSIGPAKWYVNLQDELLYRIRDKIFIGPFFDFALVNINKKNKIYSSAGIENGFITPLGDILFYIAYKIKENDVIFDNIKDRLSFGFMVGLTF